MSIVLLNMAVISIVIGIAIFLTFVAIGLIIGSLVRSHVQKKIGKKTLKLGLWIGIAMLVFPWVVVIVMLISAKVWDAKNNHWSVSREELAEVATNKDLNQIYDMMADDILEENNLSKDDLKAFLDKVGRARS